ncbi:MAG: DUF2752 domain-containing protein [Bacteroidales bacterium]|nr:DUF2752 domain-containing protein [Bacteroidales bacterium]MCF8457742.1 DUF2752 domain-containing protein [Bacteroidales bacterium]
MSSNRNKLYFFILISCFIGYIWIFYCYTRGSNGASNDITYCFIKQATNIPCPSCGSTRSVLSLMSGDILEAINYNPLGILSSLVLVVAPFWIFRDLICRKDSFHTAYQKTEFYFKKKVVAIPAIALILANWIWNIYKEL